MAPFECRGERPAPRGLCGPVGVLRDAGRAGSHALVQGPAVLAEL
jgi:hypothetical protein